MTKLLISQDYDEYIKEMTRRDLDWRNPLGQDTYKCFRYVCVMEKNMLEAARDNGGFAAAPLSTSAPPTSSCSAAPSKGNRREYTLPLSYLIQNLRMIRHPLFT